MDKIPELLIKLLDNSFLATLFSGVVLIVLSGAKKLPFVSAISPKVQTILLVLGICLILVAPFTLLKERLLSLTKVKHRDLEAQEKLELEKIKTEKLQAIMDEIQTFIGSRNDDVSLSIREILDGVRDQAREFKRASKESSLAAKWLSNRQQDILKAIYPSIKTSESPETFHSEIKQYVDLIIESLERVTYIEPNKRKIEFHIPQPFPYIEAIEAVKIQVKQELLEHKGLGDSEINRLYRCIDRLIENIRRESSL